MNQSRSQNRYFRLRRNLIELFRRHSFEKVKNGRVKEFAEVGGSLEYPAPSEHAHRYLTSEAGRSPIVARVGVRPWSVQPPCAAL